MVPLKVLKSSTSRGFNGRTTQSHTGFRWVKSVQFSPFQGTWRDSGVTIAGVFAGCRLIKTCPRARFSPNAAVARGVKQFARDFPGMSTCQASVPPATKVWGSDMELEVPGPSKGVSCVETCKEWAGTSSQVAPWKKVLGRSRMFWLNAWYLIV